MRHLHPLWISSALVAFGLYACDDADSDEPTPEIKEDAAAPRLDLGVDMGSPIQEDAAIDSGAQEDAAPDAAPDAAIDSGAQEDAVIDSGAQEDAAPCPTLEPLREGPTTIDDPSGGLSILVRDLDLPEGEVVALIGTFNGWDPSSTTAVVRGGALRFDLDTRGPFEPLVSWVDQPAGANAGFRFIRPSDWGDVVRADWHGPQGNDGNFRLALEAGAPNQIVIDGRFRETVDQAREVWVNGARAVEAERLDPRRFAFPGGKPRALVLSYDDGNLQDERFVALLEAHGLRGTFHLNSGRVGAEHYLDEGQIQRLYGTDGLRHEISGHSRTHPYLNPVPDDLDEQLRSDRDALTQIAGYPVRGFSYPFGDFNAPTIAKLRELGFAYARIVAGTGRFDLPTDLYKWRPTAHHTRAMERVDAFLSTDPEEAALFFIWGHSWELDGGGDNNNWEYMSALAARLGGHDSVWYATAVEVADYLDALRAVEIIDGREAHNRSDRAVWVRLCGQLKEIAPGERL